LKREFCNEAHKKNWPFLVCFETNPGGIGKLFFFYQRNNLPIKQKPVFVISVLERCYIGKEEKEQEVYQALQIILLGLCLTIAKI
jgi:hypothetical protein